MKIPFASTSVIVGFFSVLGATVLQLCPRTRVIVAAPFDIVASSAGRISGVSVEDLPLANSPEVAARMDELLAFDQAFLRNYGGPDCDVQVYLAYWRPGKQKPRYVADHTPDICWPYQGWTVVSRDENKVPRVSGLGPLLHCQKRVFQKGASVVNVWYWHLYGGRNSGYAEGAASIGNNWLRSFREETVEPLYEQYFIRISSTTDLDSLCSVGWFRDLLEALAPTGIDSRYCAETIPSER